MTAIRLGADDTQMVVFGDGDKEPPFALFGGKSGVCNRISLEHEDGKEVVPLSKDIVRDIKGGTIYHQVAGGGGGFGNPKERDINKVVEDVRNEVCSLQKAKDDYGVVFKPGSYEVDEEKTTQLRGSG